MVLSQLGTTVALALWLMLPAYIPNNVAVLVGGGPPIDAGKTWGGKRILGDGKTWRGSIAGVLAGFVLSLVLNEVRPYLFDFLPEFSTLAGLGLALGAILGDMGASFVKRRTGRERGEQFPLIDQLDFVAGAFLVTVLVATDWFFTHFTPRVVIAVLVLTPALHIATNIIAYKLGLKDEPW